MEIRTSTVAVVAASCITIGAAGAFLANRPSTRAPEQTSPAADVATGGVEQSEAVVSDAPVAPAAESAPAQAALSAPPRAIARTESPRPLPAARTRPAPVAPAPHVTQEARATIPDSRPVTTPPPLPEPKPVQPVIAEPIAPAAPPAPKFVDLVVSPDSVLGLQMETSVTSEKARVEDAVVARVTRDVRVGDRVAIPSGSKAP